MPFLSDPVIAPLSVEQVQLPPPVPLANWLDSALDNPSVLAAQQAIEAAAAEVQKQQAGHQPTLDLVGSISRATQGSGLTGGQSGFYSNINTLGLQLNLPLFEGGGRNARVREALAQQDKARHEHQAALRDTRLTIQRAWFALQASQARLRADDQAVHSTRLGLKSAASQQALGLKVETDTLQAQQQHDAARRDHNKMHAEVILHHLKLKAAIGTLCEADLTTLMSATTP